MPDIVARLQGDIKTALKGGDKQRAGVLRLLLSAVKQQQIDGGKAVDEAGLVIVVEKMIKQREESIRHYESAQREDLKAQEEAEIALLKPFLPPQLSEDEIRAAVDDALLSSGSAPDIKNMGAVMAVLKPRLAGRANMGLVSRLVKEKLSG